ncbi:cleavage stimulation factor subunit 2, partial [Paragonimus westermani]
MSAMQPNFPLITKEAAEKTARSIFVGNIPYEATEEKLIELFGKAGPVIGFRLVYDRESGKPKGYGFCEYNNPAIAASALRNLQNIEFNGRPLRIGPAAGEQNSAELALSNPAVGPPLESPYGDTCDPQAAPEAISRAVASLPPEQMYELMKQMKLCIQNNPNEARNMLLQNPQLAYALLQPWTLLDPISVSYNWRHSVKNCRAFWNNRLDSEHAVFPVRSVSPLAQETYARKCKVPNWLSSEESVNNAYQEVFVNKLPSSNQDGVERLISELTELFKTNREIEE